MIQNYQKILSDHVLQREEFNEATGRTSLASKKVGVVMKTSAFAQKSMILNQEYTPQGRWYPELAIDITGKRTVFKNRPFSIQGQTYYLELKGYGRDGQEIWFGEHPSKDVLFGMYLDQARREFDLIEELLPLNIPMTLPIAVIHISRQEYLRSGWMNLQQRISLAYLEEETSKGITVSSMEELRKIEAVAKRKAARYLLGLKRAFPDLEEGLRYLYTEVWKQDFSQVEALKALNSHKEIGYIIRASQCPLRLGDPRIVEATPENRMIARKMGKTFRTLLENGYLHHCPSTGNWTRAGELTDFSDVFNLRSEQKQLDDHIAEVGKRNLTHFIQYLIGPEHSGVLSPDFVEGLIGRRTSLENAVRATIRLM